MNKVADRLTNVLWQKGKVYGYLDAFQDSLDEIETCVNTLKYKRWVDSAEGAQLDGCGGIVNEPRNGRTDEEYREAIYYKIFVDVSTATQKDVNTAVRLLTKPTEQHYWDTYPACYLVYSNGINVPNNIGYLLRDITAAGVGECAFMPSYGLDAFFLSTPSRPKRLYANGFRVVVDDDKRLTVDEGGAVDNGCHLAGISMPILTVSIPAGTRTLTAGGKRLRINIPSNQSIIQTGQVLTGVFRI